MISIVKKLRFKFVLITMVLLVSVFIVLFPANYFYAKYWEEADTFQILEWIADNKLFYNAADEDDEEYNPIYEVILDKDGNIIEEKSSSNANSNVNIEKIVKGICANKAGKWKWKSYVYVCRDLNGGNKYLIFTDMTTHPFHIKKCIGTLSLIGLGFALLLWISFYLSRFVTEPAQKALEREKRFISDASHELKTPIAAIAINAQVLSQYVGKNKHMENILSETARMDKLIHNLLTLAYLEETERVKEWSHFSLSESCEEIILPLESVAFEKGITLNYEIEENIWYNGNCGEIKQVCAILLDNAIKHTPEQGEVIFKLFTKNRHPIMTVYNTGQGIAPYDLPHVFERFFCTEKSRNKKSDSFGLGLAIAKAIVISYHGTIEVKSKYGKDVLFTVNL